MIESPRFKVVIPARMGSSRLPGKPLADVAGKPLVVRVWERAVASGASDVWVAADDLRVVEAVERAGGRALLTAAEHASGTDRIAEAAETLGFDPDDVVVNLQGDEPFAPPALARALAEALEASPSAAIATAATPIRHASELFDPNVVKVTRAADGFALYFSRAPIPWVRDAFGGGVPAELPAQGLFLRHLGLYAYRVATLLRLKRMPPAALEEAERLEQLRALAAGMRIHVGLWDEPLGRGVDTPEDLEAVRAHFEREAARRSR